MAQKQKTKDRFNIVEEGSKELEALKKKRAALSPDIYKEINKAQEMFSKLESVDVRQVNEQLSKIDQGLERYSDYKTTIADLATGLSDSLLEYVDFAQKTKSYKGLETLVKFFSRTKANRMRTNRVRQQSPKENLQMILDYGEQLYEETLQVREDAIKTYTELEINTDMVVQKITIYQPKEEALKEKLDKMKEQYARLEEQCRTATAADQAKLEDQKNQLHKQLTDVQVQYGVVLTKYNQAQQILEASKKSRDSFERMVDDLGRQATMVKEKLENVARIYQAAPEAIKIMLTTKGMAKVDQAMNVATDESVDMIITSAEGVSDETLTRERIQIIAEKTMRTYIDRLTKLVEDFDKRQTKIRADARRSQAERYGLK